MKISRNWLQTYFANPLSDAATLADALTFHAFEIDGIEFRGDTSEKDAILDVKVTPNRGHDCLCHRGIAKEIAAILDIPLKTDPLKIQPILTPLTPSVQVAIIDPVLCPRYTAGYIRGVKVGPSPEWLVSALASMGQRSINNVVDATNFVMFNIGQPLHAFDAGKLSSHDGVYSIAVRKARAGERIIALDNKEYELNESVLVIADAQSDAAIGIAGVKGGLPAGVDESTTDIIIESANFNGVSVRKTAAALKLRTDASSRFEQSISPELAAYGQQIAAALIQELAGGELGGFADTYPTKQKIESVAVSVAKVNAVLGTQIPAAEIERALTRLDLSHSVVGDTYTVMPRFERLDLILPEDLVEEIGRIIGYDKVPQVELAPIGDRPAMNENYARMESAREHMIAEGYSEVYTSVFAQMGERQVLNKVGGERPYLRTNLVDGLKDALDRNVRNKDLLGLKKVKLFEIGTVWGTGAEELRVGTAEEGGEVKEYALSDIPVPDMYPAGAPSVLERYRAYSRYPAIVRDIAMWVPQNTEPADVPGIIQNHAGALLVRTELFDTFAKGEKTSLAFRLVFQSFEKTLTDDEANAAMKSVTAALQEKGFEIR